MTTLTLIETLPADLCFAPWEPPGEARRGSLIETLPTDLCFAVFRTHKNQHALHQTHLHAGRSGHALEPRQCPGNVCIRSIFMYTARRFVVSSVRGDAVCASGTTFGFREQPDGRRHAELRTAHRNHVSLKFEEVPDCSGAQRFGQFIRTHLGRVDTRDSRFAET